MGVGSDVYGALVNGRKGIGIELKPSYFVQAQRNIAHCLKNGRNRNTDDQQVLIDSEDADFPESG
jgi:hypothetical protein